MCSGVTQARHSDIDAVFKTAFKYAKGKQQPSPLMTAQSMLIHFDVTAINGQVNATTRDALDGNTLFYWLRKATTTCHVKWNCSNQFIKNEILLSYAIFKKYLSMPKGASQVH